MDHHGSSPGLFPRTARELSCRLPDGVPLSTPIGRWHSDPCLAQNVYQHVYADAKREAASKTVVAAATSDAQPERAGRIRNSYPKDSLGPFTLSAAKCSLCSPAHLSLSGSFTVGFVGT